MKTKIFGGLLIAVIAMTSLAKAQDRTPVINRRLNNQEHRINQGVRDGELNGNQARYLLGQDRRIREQEHDYKASGHISYGQRRQLRNEEDRTSRAIYRDRHHDSY